MKKSRPTSTPKDPSRTQTVKSDAGQAFEASEPGAREIKRLLRECEVLRTELTRKNEELRRAQYEAERAHEILTSISDGLICLDHDLVVTHFNKAAETLLDRRTEDILGRKLFDAFPEARGSVFEEEYTRALRERKFTSFETYFSVEPYEDWYDVRVYPSEEGLTVFFQVITGRKQSEQKIEELNRSLQLRLSELETIFETAPVGIAIADDSEGRHIRGNPANERMLGLPRGGEHSMRAPDGLAPAYHVTKDGRQLTVDELPMQRAVRGETVTGEALSVTREDGSVVELLCNAAPLLDKEGRPRGAVGAFQDITQLKCAEEGLRKAHDELETRVQTRTAELVKLNEALQTEIADRVRAEAAALAERKRFFDVLKMLPAYVVLLTPDYRVAFANRVFQHLFGEPEGQRCYELLFGLTEPCQKCETFKVLKTMEPCAWEWTGPNGRSYSIYDYPFTEPDGSTLILEMGIDITERKEAENALRKLNETLEQQVAARTAELAESEAKFRSAFANAAIGFAMTTPEGRFVDANPAYCALTGYDLEELRSLTFPRLIHPEDAAENLQLIDRMSSGDIPSFVVDNRYVRKDGGVVWVRKSVSLVRTGDGAPQWIIALVQDVTERKKAEESLRASEQRMQQALHVSNSFTFEWRPDSDRVLRSASCGPILRLSGDEVCNDTGQGFFQRVHPEDRPRFTQMLSNLTPAADNYTTEYRVVRGDGSVAILEEMGQGTFDTSGRLQMIVGVTTDVTARRFAEEALRLSEQRLHLALEASGAVTWGWDITENRLEDWTQAYRRLYGFGDDEAATFDTWLARIHPDDRQRILDRARRILETPGDDMWHEEFRILHPQHGERWLGGLGRCYRDESGRPLRMAGVNFDITDRKEAEKAIRWIARRDHLLSDTAARLLQSDDPQTIIEDLCRQVMDFLDCHTFFNYLAKVGEERLYLNACAGIADEEARKIEWLEYGVAVCGCVARDRERIIVEDILNAPDPRTALVTSYGIQAYCCHPLIVQGRLIGTLSFGSRTQLSFSPEQVEVMKTVTDLVASAMHRIKTEEALRESREDLDRAQSVGQIGWWRLDTRHNVLTWSDENYRIFGVRKGTPLTYESFLETLHPDDRQDVDAMWQAALRGEPYDIEHRIVADGQVKWVREKAYLEFDAAGHLQGGFGITQDITGRKQAEEALRESEASLRTAQEALQKANEELECRVRQRTEELLRANRELEKKRYDLNERVKELNCLYRVSHLLREREVILASVLQEVVNMIPSGWQFPEITGAGITLNGLEVRTENFRNTLWKLQRPILIHGAVQGMITVVYCEKPPADAAGPFLSEEDTLIETLAGLIGDFMESLRSRTLLEESEGRYRRVSQQFHALLDAIPDMLVLVSADLRILWANRAAVARSGLTQEALVGQTYDHLLVGLKAGGKACPAKACFDSGQLTTTRFGTLGSMIWDVHAVPVKDEAGTVGNVILIARDVTSELRLQEEGIRSDRLASLGELAAGVAHEINNPINSIINYAQILANKADTRTKEHAFTEEIVKEGERIAGIVRSLLAFARDARDAKYPTSLHDVLSASLVLTTAQLKRDGIDVRIAAPEDLPPVQANQQQIQQVLLNLISNARYALNKKYHGSHPDKILAISGDSRTIDGKAYVHVEVRDHGTGIPKDLLSRVTDPFFTTKPMGEGTGLGLSISNGIVVDHGGRLTVESVEGEYTTVMIDLPVSSAKETS